MAKMFYTMEETKSALGKNEEEIKQFAREGRLREFRDGPRLMFKADQVEQLKAELAGAGEPDTISLAPSGDSGAPIGLAGDTSGGSRLGLVDLDAPGQSKGDTHLADMGLSGSVGGVPSPSRGAPGSGTGLTNLTDSAAGAAASKGGITIFDVDESQRADPSAQTSINSNVRENVNLDSVGSGSGLLDLTRESDDTSLGAVFDELTPATPATRRQQGPARQPAMEAPAGDVGMAAIDRGARTALTAPIAVAGPDAMSVALGGASLGATVIVGFGGFVLITSLLGYRPQVLDTVQTQGLMYAGIAVAVVLVFFAVGFFIGKR